jgi:hypothetical protein
LKEKEQVEMQRKGRQEERKTRNLEKEDTKRERKRNK